MDSDVSASVASSLLSSSMSDVSIESNLSLSFSSDLESVVIADDLSFSDCLLSSDSSSSESDDEETTFGTSERQTPLYPGATLTVFDSYLLLLRYSLRHGLTKSAFSDLIGLVSKHLPSGSTSTSLYKLKRYFVNLYSDIKYNVNYCCSQCHRLLENPRESCPSGCGQEVADFLTISVEAQLRRRMEDLTFWERLQHRFKAAGGEHSVIRDVYDGKEYGKHKRFLSQPGNVTFIVNTDGVAVFNSSTVSIWPIWLAVNELPPDVRFKQDNLLLAGLWFRREKPTMTTFLKPLTVEMNELCSNGISVNTPAGEMVVKAALLMCAADLPARAMLQNIKQFNGEFGCPYCEDAGVPRPSCHLHRDWPYCENSKLRTHQSVLANARAAVASGTSVQGVKGATVFCTHKKFDICTGFVIDTLHCVFLGVVLAITKLWFGATHSRQPYSLRRQLKECDARLLGIQVPHDISRRPQSLNSIAHRKASEFRAWLLFYSLPVLRGLLPQPYLAHWALLVAAMHMLHSDVIPHRSVETAESYLLQFYKDCPTLYGMTSVTMNVHLLRHLGNCVRQWGPLWAYSCFSFESLNRQLKKFFHGTRNMNCQLAFSFIMGQILPRAIQTAERSRGIQLPGGWKGVGKVWEVRLSAELRQLIQTQFGVHVESASQFLRARILGDLYHSVSYTRLRTRNNYTVCYHDRGDQYGHIEFYLAFGEHAAAVVSPHLPATQNCWPTCAPELETYLIHVTKSSRLALVPLESIVCKCVFIHTQHFYVCKFLPYLKQD